MMRRILIALSLISLSLPLCFKRVRVLLGITGVAVAVVAAPAVEAAEIPLKAPAATDWPWWRGTQLNGVAAPGQQPPTQWNSNSNIVWKSDIPGRGHSTPCVRGDRLYVATADEGKRTQHLLAYDRKSGDLVWNRELRKGNFPESHNKNTFASASPACDGERVFITFVNDEKVWLAATDLEGKILWQEESGPFNSQFGFSSSPAIYKSLVISVGDSQGTSFMTAHNRDTGKVRWRVTRNNMCSYSSPFVTKLAGKAQLIAAGGNAVTSYNPNNGQPYWTCDGPTNTISGTPTFAGDLLFVSAGYPGSQTYCVRTGGKGNISRTPNKVWQNSQKCYTPSLVAHEGFVYGISDDGVAYCWDAKTGKERYRQRLGGGFSASPIIANGNIYAPNEDGKTYVYKTGPKYQVVSENDLNDGGFASPVIVGGQIFLRTNHKLYCIGKERNTAAK